VVVREARRVRARARRSVLAAPGARGAAVVVCGARPACARAGARVAARAGAERGAVGRLVASALAFRLIAARPGTHRRAFGLVVAPALARVAAVARLGGAALPGDSRLAARFVLALAVLADAARALGGLVGHRARGVVRHLADAHVAAVAGSGPRVAV